MEQDKEWWGVTQALLGSAAFQSLSEEISVHSVEEVVGRGDLQALMGLLSEGQATPGTAPKVHTQDGGRRQHGLPMMLSAVIPLPHGPFSSAGCS